MARPPVRGVRIATPDIDASRRFWSILGYEAHGGRLTCGRGADIVLESSSDAGPVRVGWDLGPRGLDVYVNDLDAAATRLADHGHRQGAVADISIGPVRMRQCAVLGPANEPLVLVESSHRRPSMLDEGERVFSEVYSVVWCVESRDEVAGTFADAVLGPPLSFSDPSMGPYLSLPVADATLDMITIADAEGSSTRLELLSFPGRAHRAVAATSGVTGIEFADGTWWESSTS